MSEQGTKRKQGRTQNLRDFTVQIRTPDHESIVGTGIAVTNEGGVVTCAHVVEAVLGVHPRDAGDAEIGVYFPQALGGERKERQATVSAYFSEHDDDVVLLQLVDGGPPLGPGQMPTLGRAELSEGNGFRSYGYRRLDDYIAGFAHGTIMGVVESPPGRNVQAEPVQLESQQINHGMSSSAVLDIERNHVVGIVSETWFPDLTGKDRDTAWAVDGCVLSLEPLNLILQDEPEPLRPAPEPRTDAEAARAAVAPELELSLNDPAPPLPEWVGRAGMLEELNEDWTNPDKRVTGLIGFGGEGKSSLARRWLDELLEDESQPQPDGVFWWGFYTRPNVDEFFEAALTWMSGGRVDPRKAPSANVRAQIIGAMLGAGRYLFVMDGLEIMQEQEGDRYGLLRSNDLREFLEFFANPGHESFCLVTSRAPLLDLMAYTTYTHRDVDRLSEGDGRDLLRAVGVTGPDEALDEAVTAWDGHALTLSLIGGYLADAHGGDIAKLDEIPPPTADEPRYERVHRVLRRYDDHLTEPQRAFLKLFSAFRTPVAETAFETVFRTATSETSLNVSLAEMDDEAFTALVERLKIYRLLRYDPAEAHYTAHPLVRNHYLAMLTQGDRAQATDAHTSLKDYYLEVAGDTLHNPTLDDLLPLIEVVHHACRAGAFDEAFQIRDGRIGQGNRFVLGNILGANETQLAIVREFFPEDDTSQEPQVSNPRDKSWILNEVGFCLMSLGRLSEAPPFLERSIAGYLTDDLSGYAGRVYLNLATLHIQLGALTASVEAAEESLSLARRAESKSDERDSLIWQAWAAHLQGDLAFAAEVFGQAKTLELEYNPSVKHLSRNGGVYYGIHLRRFNNQSIAREVIEANFDYCNSNRWFFIVSGCHCVLGDLDTDAGQVESARDHYDTALDIARGITMSDVLIEALLGRGRFRARHMKDPASAFSDLEEALGYATGSGFRIYETDIRVAMAWAHLVAGERDRARAEARRAHQMSEEMGYHWGQVDADEVLEEIGD